MRKAHELGIRTWVSLEPVIEPAESIEIIRRTGCYGLVKECALRMSNWREEIEEVLIRKT